MSPAQVERLKSNYASRAYRDEERARWEEIKRTAPRVDVLAVAHDWQKTLALFDLLDEAGVDKRPTDHCDTRRCNIAGIPCQKRDDGTFLCDAPAERGSDECICSDPENCIQPLEGKICKRHV